MRGTDKQTAYAAEITETLKRWAADMLDTPDAERGTAEAMRLHTQKGLAAKVTAEMAVIDAVEAGDIAKAQELFSKVERDHLLAACIQDGIDAGKIIDTYKKIYYDVRG